MASAPTGSQQEGRRESIKEQKQPPAALREEDRLPIATFAGIGPEGRTVAFSRVFDFSWTHRRIVEMLRSKLRTEPDQIFELSFRTMDGEDRELNSENDVPAFIELGRNWGYGADEIDVAFFLPPPIPVLQQRLHEWLRANLAQPPLPP